MDPLRKPIHTVEELWIIAGSRLHTRKGIAEIVKKRQNGALGDGRERGSPPIPDRQHRPDAASRARPRKRAGSARASACPDARDQVCWQNSWLPAALTHIS